MKRVFLFPGQGSQVAGMGRNFYEQSPEAREIFRLADEVLGFSCPGFVSRGRKRNSG